MWPPKHSTTGTNHRYRCDFSESWWKSITKSVQILYFSSIFQFQPPDGFDVILSTTLGYPADLNHGSIGQKSCFLCFRRGYHKAPLVDIGILDEGRGDKPMVDSNVVQTTPFGRCANVNNASQVGNWIKYEHFEPKTAILVSFESYDVLKFCWC